MSLFSEKQVLFLSAQDSTRNCHRKEIASCWCWSPGLGMQRFRASITFWTMSLLVKTNEIQYHLLRGYTSSSADGDSVGHTAPVLGHSFRLRLINWHVAATLPVAEVNLCPLPILTGCKKKKKSHSAIRHSSFSFWNVAVGVPSASAWSSCLWCKTTSLAAIDCSCRSIIQRCCATQLGLNKPGTCPYRCLGGSKLLDKMPLGILMESWV